MSNIDWSKAPKMAACYAGGAFRNGALFWSEKEMSWVTEDSKYMQMGGASVFPDYEARPQEWPEENRIDAIAQNGATGDHYQFVDASEMVAAQDFLSEGLKILSERGGQYGSDKRECSFPQVAQAFNAITGNNLMGSDVCLILALVKQVRQYAQPNRFHQDSAVDGVNYIALQAQELRKERNN